MHAKTARLGMLLALFLLSASVVRASSITLDPTSRGSYGPDGMFSSGGAGTPTGNYFIGEDGFGAEGRDFFVFSLTDVDDPVVSATMTFSVHPLFGYVSLDDATETVTLFDYTGSLSNLAGGTAGVTGFVDLGTGAIFGTRVFSSADLGQTVTIMLTPPALTSINAALGGLWAFGGALTTLGDPAQEGVFGASSNRLSQLTVTTEPARVPEPSSCALLTTGLLGLILRRRTNRN